MSHNCVYQYVHEDGVSVHVNRRSKIDTTLTPEKQQQCIQQLLARTPLKQIHKLVGLTERTVKRISFELANTDPLYIQPTNGNNKYVSDGNKLKQALLAKQTLEQNPHIRVSELAKILRCSYAVAGNFRRDFFIETNSQLDDSTVTRTVDATNPILSHGAELYSGTNQQRANKAFERARRNVLKYVHISSIRLVAEGRPDWFRKGELEELHRLFRQMDTVEA